MTQALQSSQKNPLQDVTTLELAQILAHRLSIASNDWHRLKANRKAQAQQQLGSALVFLLKDHPEEALARIQQAAGWLDHSISAPPCPSHGPSLGYLDYT